MFRTPKRKIAHILFIACLPLLLTACPPPRSTGNPVIQTKPPQKPDVLNGYDPLYKDQWYLENTGQFGGKAGVDINVKGVWNAGYLGTGIHIGVLDSLVDAGHPDLAPNLPTSNLHNLSGRTACEEAHGTNVAGVIAARDNGLGIQGIAPRATLYSYAVTTGRNPDSTYYEYIAAAYTHFSGERSKIAVYNASLGVGESSYTHPDAGIYAAFASVLREGFNGKGSSLVYAAGNNVFSMATSNNNFLLNHYAVIAVNSLLKTGTVRSRQGGTHGNNLWLLAPTAAALNDDKYVTTDPRDIGQTCGAEGNYWENFGSTSGATPMVSGVIALVRQKAPRLTWRDVKLLLAESANKSYTDPKEPYVVTGKMYSSPGSEQRYSRTAAFGLVDAQAAWTLAANWRPLPAMKTEEYSSRSAVPLSSLDTLYTSTVSASGTGISYIESVNILLEIEPPAKNTPLIWELQLIAPDGKKAVLYPYDADNKMGSYSYLNAGTEKLHFLANNFLGSDRVNGRWQLKLKFPTVAGAQTQSPISKIKSWKLTVRGH
ncbi:MAG: S8 family serine peptidase [Spirochaetota bacterium]